MLYVILISYFTASWEWYRYSRLLDPEYSVPVLDLLCLFLILAFKNLILLAVPACAAYLAPERYRFPIVGVASLPLMGWVLLDAECQSQIGASFPGAGFPSGSIGLLGCLALGALACWYLGERLVKLSAKAGFGLLAIFLLFGSFSLSGYQNPEIYRKLYQRLPFDFAFFRWRDGVTGDPRLSSVMYTVSRELEQDFRDVEERLNEPRPLEEVDFSAEKDVLIIVCESLNRDAFTNGHAELNDWMGRGVRLEEHYSAGNASHLGVFGLLYGREALRLEGDLEAGLGPQMIHSLRQAGYECYYYSSSPFNWRLEMERGVNERFFEELDEGTERPADWVRLDRQNFRRARELLTEPHSRPRFVLVYPHSTHQPYVFPPEFAQPDKSRYSNAMDFLQAEVWQLVSSLELENTVVVLTADHGEGNLQDGTTGHGTLLSTAQCVVPCTIVGGGAPTRTVTTATSHTDLLPTLFHILAGRSIGLKTGHGVDLLATEPGEHNFTVVGHLYPNFPRPLMVVSGGHRLLLTRGERWRVVGLLDDTGQLLRDLPEGLQAEELISAVRERFSRW